MSAVFGVDVVEEPHSKRVRTQGPETVAESSEQERGSPGSRGPSSTNVGNRGEALAMFVDDVTRTRDPPLCSANHVTPLLSAALGIQLLPKVQLNSIYPL